MKHTLTFNTIEEAQEALGVLACIEYRTRSISSPNGIPTLTLRTEIELEERVQAALTEALQPKETTFNQAEEMSIDTSSPAPDKPRDSIAQAELDHYAECDRLISIGAYTERNGDKDYPEDGIEEFIDKLDYRAALLGFHIVCDKNYKQCHLGPMTDEEKAEFKKIHEKNGARDAILAWAKTYYASEGSSDVPEVEVMDPVKRNGNVWTAELWVPSSEDGNPRVAFCINEQGYAIPDRIEYPNSSIFFKMAETVCWHQERKSAEWTEYYLLLKDGNGKPVSCILKHNKVTNAFQTDPYTPLDYDYTIHDGCDHENNDCILNSEAFQQEAWLSSKHAMALRAEEHQLRLMEKRRLVDRLRADKAELKRIEFVEAE